MNKCTNCGSHAINPHMHGRGGDNLGLCDVCYWRTRFDALREAVARMLYIDTPENFEGEKHIKARAEVDWLIADASAADCEGDE